MNNIRRLIASVVGVGRPLSGPAAPMLVGLVALGALSIGCGDQERQESLAPLQVGMTPEVAPIYDDGELVIYEVKKGRAFPILEPGERTRGELEAKTVEPYGRMPWVTTKDVSVQVSWTLSNLDEEERVVEVLVDPWNEFGRYFPGLQLTDAENQEFMPNFSGIDQRYIVGGRNSGDASRVHGTYTYADLEEMATDLATVMGIIENPPETEGGAEEEDPRVPYANHAFHWQNRSYNDLLVKKWIPGTVAGLTGLDIGFRTYDSPGNLAIEVVIELVDEAGDRIRKDGDDATLLEPTEEIITVGVAP